MEKFIADNGRGFNYRVVRNNYIVITGYFVDEGEMTFPKSDDGYYRHRIDVPETIEGLPVLALSSFSLKMKMYGVNGYRHNGSSFIELHLPEHTVFKGFERVQTHGGYFYPNYRVENYKRRKCDLLLCEEGRTAFLAKPIDKDTCQIVQIIMKDGHNNELRIPQSVCGYRVVSIAAESTYYLPETLKTIKLTDGIKNIGANCFRNLPCLQSVYLGKETEHIAEGCFYFYEEGGEDSIKSVTPLTVYYHKKPACSSLAFCRGAELWIEEHRHNIGWVKVGVKQLKYGVVFTPFTECVFHIENNVLIKCKSNLPCITVPEGVKAIADFAFYENAFLQSAILPNGVEKIGAYAFKNCVSLKEISIPKSVKAIGEGAFQNCSELCNIAIPDNTETIEKGLCRSCVKLGKIKLPKHLSAISEYAFEQCPVSKLDIPNGTKCIRYHAFAGCSKLQSVSLPESLENVDIYAFPESCLVTLHA